MTQHAIQSHYLAVSLLKGFNFLCELLNSSCKISAHIVQDFKRKEFMMRHA